MLDTMGAEKKLVMWSFAFMFATFAIMGIFMEQTVAVTQYGNGVTSFDGDLPVEHTQVGDFSTNPKKLKAIVKGSIYETGSNMTVYGACFDGDGYLLPEATAEFTAWYPNGTIMVGPNETMDKIYDDFDGYHVNGTGRWKIHVTMVDTIGTYLTEMRCIQGSEWAVAFGEWQNPEWVQRIGDMDTRLSGLAQNITEFRNDTNNNFSSVLTAIDNIDVSGDVSAVSNDVRELTEMVQALDVNIWKLDETNPFYVLESNAHDFTAVDMLSPNAVAAVSSDGYVVLWDGESWTEYNQSAVEFRGVSVLPSNTVYAWAVGGQAGSPVFSINGGTPQSFNLSGGGSPTVMNDIKLFQAPNSPNSDFYGYVVGNDGSVYYSSDSGASWSYIGTTDAASTGRISQVVENYDAYAQVNGYMVLVGQGDTVLLHDGSSALTVSLNGTIKGVDLLYYNFGYVVTENTSSSFIYRFNGTAFTQEYEIEDATIVPTGVEINTQDDIWVATKDPSTFYHFDGRSWEYSTVGYSDYVSVIISFNNSLGNASSIGVEDITMFDSKHGYAVGGDGLILIYKQHYDDVLDAMLTNLTTQLSNLTANVNLTEVTNYLAYMNETLGDVNLTVNNIYTYVQQMNTTLGDVNTTVNNIYTDVQEINSTLSYVNTTLGDMYTFVQNLNTTISADISEMFTYLQAMNASMEYKLDNILSNTTYTNLYLETTLFPMVNATYQNTLQILIQLGILEGKINQTIELQNQTLQIVNETSTDVDELVNRSRRIRAWITQ